MIYATDDFCQFTEFAFADSPNSQHGGDRLEAVTGPDYDAIDRALGNDGGEPTETDRAAEALTAVLQWICANCPDSEASPPFIAARALSLALLLRSELTGNLQTLTDIANLCGVTKAAISKSLLQLQDVAGAGHLKKWKSDASRKTYSEVQKRSWQTRMATVKANAAKAKAAKTK